MKIISDVVIILGVFILLWAASNYLRSLAWLPRWKNFASYLVAAALSISFLLLDRQGPFAGGIYFILIVFFIYTAYLTEIRFKDN